MAIPNDARTLYLLLYEVVDDFLTQRTLYRGDHLQAVAEAHARGELLQGGALVDPADGAALLFATDDRSVVERFADNDPYVKAGLVKSWKVRKWNAVIGPDGVSAP